MKLTVFIFNKQPLPVSFVETQAVKEGVECDIYTFVGDQSKDLAIVRVLKGHKTPLQKILLGNKTIEGLVDGKGKFELRRKDGIRNTYEVSSASTTKEFEVEVGDVMQWQADSETDLSFYEICEPPYRDGRFENLPE